MEEREGDYRAWLFVAAGAVPPEWQDRAIEVALVPLLPQEAAAILTDRTTAPTIEEGDMPLVRLVARGKSGTEIARHLGMSPRSVYRRLARLRGLFNVDSSAELASELARRGF